MRATVYTYRSPKGVFDCSYPTSKLRRGRVIQGGR
nr:MAG TPA: hypothetical protein [Caudoviricetes sp.]